MQVKRVIRYIYYLYERCRKFAQEPTTVDAEKHIAEAEPDRRRASRRRVLKQVQIVSQDKLSVLDCHLKSLSREGALITGEYMIDLPDRFYIRTSGQVKLVPCEVVRRTLTSVAVRFQGDPGKLVECLYKGC